MFTDVLFKAVVALYHVNDVFRVTVDVMGDRARNLKFSSQLLKFEQQLFGIPVSNFPALYEHNWDRSRTFCAIVKH